jgi:spore maturation protein SpmA
MKNVIWSGIKRWASILIANPTFVILMTGIFGILFIWMGPRMIADATDRLLDLLTGMVADLWKELIG